jgi:hypothetical protein
LATSTTRKRQAGDLPDTESDAITTDWLFLFVTAISNNSHPAVIKSNYFGFSGWGTNESSKNSASSCCCNLIATPVLAAVIEVKAPPPPGPVSNWTGWYAGLNAGGAWADAPETVNTATGTFCNPGLGGCLKGTNWANDWAATVPSTLYLGNNASFIGGGQIGYNYQHDQSVFGIEADFQGLDVHGASNVTNVGTTTVTFIRDD